MRTPDGELRWDGPYDDECPECGGRLVRWGRQLQEHTEEHHRVRRRILMRAVRQKLRQEYLFRADAMEEAVVCKCVVIRWRVTCLLGKRGEFTSLVPFDVWDVFNREALLAQMGRGLRDFVENERGFRPHHVETKYRVFDGRRP
jgi:hypothetical protein